MNEGDLDLDGGRIREKCDDWLCCLREIGGHDISEN